jgi:hypothetical protein
MKMNINMQMNMDMDTDTDMDMDIDIPLTRKCAWTGHEKEYINKLIYTYSLVTAGRPFHTHFRIPPACERKVREKSTIYIEHCNQLMLKSFKKYGLPQVHFSTLIIQIRMNF